MKLTLKHLREKRGWSLKLAEKIYGIPAKTIKQYEEYKKIPKVEDLTTILKMVGMDYEELIPIIYEDINSKYGVINACYSKIIMEEKNMTEDLRNNTVNSTMLRMGNNVVFLGNNNGNVTICSANNAKDNITFYEDDILEISKIRKERIDIIRNRRWRYTNYDEVKVGNVIVNIGSNWLLLMNRDTLLSVNVELFEKLVQYIKYRRRGER